MKSCEELHKYKIISIVGAGGKTTLMFMLAKKLGENNKVLITTTTKIYVPQCSDYKKMEIGHVQKFQISDKLENGIYVYGSAIRDNKLLGASEEDLNVLKDCFDYIIIESDGSNRKPLKAWRDGEPVIYSGTELTIGVIDIQTLEKTINESNIHRLPLFLNLTDSKEGDKIDINHLIKVITSKQGLFKDIVGKKMLFVNKVESIKDKERAHSLIRIVKEKMNFEYTVIGSAKEGKIELI